MSSGLLVDCWWIVGGLLMNYGGEYLDNFFTIQ